MPTPRDRKILETIAQHGRLTREHVRQLFYRRGSDVATPQAVNARLLRLTQWGSIAPVVTTGRHGSGPYAYGLTRLGRSLIRLGGSAASARVAAGPVWHQLEIADFRVRLELSLRSHQGRLLEWVGEPALRAMLRGVRGPVPDALVHWQHGGLEGSFLLEWDRGTETLGILTAKIGRYHAWFRSRGHRVVIPGLGLRPRLAIVVASELRAMRLLSWAREQRPGPPSLFVAIAHDALTSPLGNVWTVPGSTRPTQLFR